MATVFTNVIFWRGIERLTIVFAAGFTDWLGYRLYIAGITSGTSSMNAEGSTLFKFAFSGTGPGLVFMGMGTLLLMIAVLRRARIHDVETEFERQKEMQAGKSPVTNPGQPNIAAGGSTELPASILSGTQIEYFTAPNLSTHGAHHLKLGGSSRIVHKRDVEIETVTPDE